MKKYMILFFTFISLACTAGEKKANESGNVSFDVSSLNADGFQMINLQITIDADGNAIVQKSMSPASVDDIVNQHVVNGSNTASMSILSSSDGVNEVALADLPSEYYLFGVPIELDKPAIQNADGSVTFYCIGSKCDENSSCEMTFMQPASNEINIK